MTHKLPDGRQTIGLLHFYRHNGQWIFVTEDELDKVELPNVCFAIRYPIKDIENKDPKEVIIDEFVGQSIPIYLYEISHGTEKSAVEAIIFYGVCFILFRFFDIAKPFPVSYFDKNFKNSFGVIMDDVCAGFYVVLSLICFMFLSSYFI